MLNNALLISNECPVNLPVNLKLISLCCSKAIYLKIKVRYIIILILKKNLRISSYVPHANAAVERRR